MLLTRNRIVLVANTKKPPNVGYKKHMSSFDLAMFVTNKLLARAIKNTGNELVSYNNIDDFIKNIHSHKSDLVFPYYHGIASRNRESYVQAICEIYNIKYLGGDAYVQIITNDKVLSKDICRYSGIMSPTSKVLFDKDYPPDILSLNPPLIVKPQFEGDSIGISDANFFNSHNGVLDFATNLLNDLQQPILIEEFIEGKEVSVCLIGYKREIKKIRVVEFLNNGTLFNYRDKKFKFKLKKYRNADNLLNEEMRGKIINLFHSLDKMEFMRIDFIYKNDTFYHIELTADPALAPTSAMYWAFKHEMSYTQYIGFLISNCQERYKLIENGYL